MDMGVKDFRRDTLIARHDGLLFTLAVDEYFNAWPSGYGLLKIHLNLPSFVFESLQSVSTAWLLLMLRDKRKASSLWFGRRKVNKAIKVLLNCLVV
jgi:hypothetical protein